MASPLPPDRIDEPVPDSLSGLRVPWYLLVLATPIIASMISRTAMSFADFVMVSQLGPEAQAAIMPAGILLFCVIAFSMGTLSVISTFVSQSLGRDRPADCSAYAWQGIHLSVVLAAVALPGWLLAEPLFAWVGHEPTVQRMEVIYVQIGLLGLAPTMMAAALSGFFQGIHNPAVTFWAALASNIINIIVNYALIFGNWGFPAMGIAGAAWGTLIAAFVQAMILLAWMLRPSMNRRFHSRHTWRPNVARIRRIVWYGLPAGLQMSTDVFAFTVFTLLLVGRFGTEQLAAHNIAFKLLEISFMPAIGLGMAVTAAVGKSIGQGDPQLARRFTRWAMLITVSYMGLIGAVYLLGRPGLIATLRLSDDPTVIAWASRLLLFCALFQVFDALNIVHMSALRGAGDNHWPAAVVMAYAVLVLLGGSWLMIEWRPDLGSVGPWAAATVYICLLGVTMWARWTFGPWEKIDIFGPAAPAELAPPEAVE